MEHKKDFIAIDVDETLYFERGQEIDEMLSISLDPDITLEEYESYVQILGIIVLNGSYRKIVAETLGDQANTTHSNDVQYIEKIVDQNNNEADFYHRLPIDITIPKERVRRVEDVTVEITDFDYELQDNRTMKINSMLHIGGLQDQEKPEKDVEHQKIEEPETDIIDVEHKDVEETDAHKHDKMGYDEQERETQAEVIDSQSKNTESSLDLEEDDEGDEDVTDEEKQEIDISLKKTEEDEDTDEVKDVQFLTDLFGGSEEEMLATVTIYITQEDDTVESIAKRFEIPALQLMKNNDISGDQLTSGQLINIPRN